MRPTTRATVAVASLLALVAGVFAFGAGPVSAGEVGQDLVIEKTVVGGSDDDFQLIAGCDSPMVEFGTAATVDVPFVLADGEITRISEAELETQFGLGLECTIAEEVAEGVVGIGIVVMDEDGELIASGGWDADELPPVGDVVTLDFPTDLPSTDYFIEVFNIFPADSDLCELGTAYLSLSESLDVGTSTPEQLEEGIGAIISLLLEADAAGVPAEYQDALDTLTAVYIDLNVILSSVDYEVSNLYEEQVEEVEALAEAGEAAEEVLAPGFVDACEAPPIPVPAPTPTPDTRPANAVQARPAFTG